MSNTQKDEFVWNKCISALAEVIEDDIMFTGNLQLDDILLATGKNTQNKYDYLNFYVKADGTGELSYTYGTYDGEGDEHKFTIWNLTKNYNNQEQATKDFIYQILGGE